MPDWLETFGTFQANLPANLGADGFYLPTNGKSLVVSDSISNPRLSHRLSESWVVLQVSILSAGTFFGALFAFPMGDMVGRKWGLVASCVIFCLGVGLQLDTHWITFIVGRVIAGIGVVHIYRFSDHVYFSNSIIF